MEASSKFQLETEWLELLSNVGFGRLAKVALASLITLSCAYGFAVCAGCVRRGSFSFPALARAVSPTSGPQTLPTPFSAISAPTILRRGCILLVRSRLGVNWRCNQSGALFPAKTSSASPLSSGGTTFSSDFL